MAEVRRVGRDGLRAPGLVVDLEVYSGREHGMPSLAGYKSMFCLHRRDGIPVGLSYWDVEEGAQLDFSELSRAGMSMPSTVGSSGAGISGSRRWSLTVVVCTRERPDGLARLLRSLSLQTDSEFRVIVMDNAPVSDRARMVVEQSTLGDVRYAVAEVAGLSRARNAALSCIDTELVAWVDDDEVADARWVERVKWAFSESCGPAAVCGVMLPARLDTDAEVRFEQYGGFNKGRTLVPQVLNSRSVASALYPLPSFGAGGNMSFQVDALREVGGFDPCLGAGTRTCGGEETRVLSALIMKGEVVLYWPLAITWHYHRQTLSELERQLFGYSAGMSAFIMSAVIGAPQLAAELVRLIPIAVRETRGGVESQRLGHLPEDFPAGLTRAARRGLIYGAPLYALERILERAHRVG